VEHTPRIKILGLLSWQRRLQSLKFLSKLPPIAVHLVQWHDVVEDVPVVKKENASSQQGWEYETAGWEIEILNPKFEILAFTMLSSSFCLVQNISCVEKFIQQL
jgi:hypothetical protein